MKIKNNNNKNPGMRAKKIIVGIMLHVAVKKVIIYEVLLTTQ